MSDTGRKFLSDLKLYSDFLKWKPDLGRYERWDEAVDDIIMGTHGAKYPHLKEALKVVADQYKDKLILASQRSLQYRSDQIYKHNARLYNCCTTYCYSPDVFAKGFYVLLCGAGLGVNMHYEFVDQLPTIKEPTKGVKPFVVEDCIEGWSDALNALISSFCTSNAPNKEYQGWSIKYDFSKIREKGAFISGGFRAPGPEGLKNSLQKIEDLLRFECRNGETKFRDIVAYDIFMHTSNAVLSGGVRRSAMDIMFDYSQTELLNAKIGEWFNTNPQRARSNNSVMLFRNNFEKDLLDKVLSINDGMSDLGFVFVDNHYQIFNPCFEIGFNFYKKIKNRNKACFQFCNLNEINASKCRDDKGKFSYEKFILACEQAAILGTFQASYTSFPYLGEETERIVAGEALLGISITGWMSCPELFNAEILQEGARIVKETNRTYAEILGINPAARTTTVKPSGNASVILETSSGIHPEHFKNYFRIMQLNKDSDTARFLEKNMPELIEESVWSASNSDYVVYVPIKNSDNVIFKDDMKGVKHLELIKLVQENWINPGKNEEFCYDKDSNHNVSCTVIIDNYEEISNYIFDNQNSFTAVSFLSEFGDKDYSQAPNTSVLTTQEIIDKYGQGSLFASGLIVDALHYFSNNLWLACSIVQDPGIKLVGTRDMLLLQKDWIRRAKQFSKNYFKSNTSQMIYCLKDVHLWHKWNTINREFKKVNFEEVLTSPKYKDVQDYAAQACAGGACEI